MSLVATPHEGPTTGEPAPAFQQKLGLFDSTMLVAGAMIGSGIFIVSAEISRDVGSAGWLLLVWAVTGVMTIIGALSYAELAAMMPQAGGQYVYLREAYSPLWGFLYGWTLFLVIQTGSIAAVAVAFAKFLGVLVPELGTDPKAGAWVLLELGSFSISVGQCVAVFIVALLTLVNCLGVREGKWVQNIFTVAKTLALIMLILVGLTLVANLPAIRANTTDWWGGIKTTSTFSGVRGLFPEEIQPPGLTGLVIFMVVGGAMVGSLFAADAWNNVTFTAGEVKNPRRNLPWSLALGTGLVIVLYLLANVTFVTALPVQGDVEEAKYLDQEAQAGETRAAQLDEEAASFTSRGLEAEAQKSHQAATMKRDEAKALRASAAYQRGIDHAKDDRVGTAVLELASPNLGVPLMALAIMVSTFGCINGMILMGARLYYAMARDGLFFQAVGRLNRRGVPAIGLLLQGVWSCLLVFSGTYGQLLDYIIFAALLFYVLTVIGLFILRYKQPTAERPYRAFGYPVIPALYVILCAVIMLDLLVVKPTYTWPGLIIVLTGIPVYLFWRWRQRLPVARG